MVDSKDLSSYLKHYGFLLPNAEIYGGLAKAWDLGPYGAELKRNLKNLWWKYFITSSPYNVGCDSLIITHPQVLEASGHRKNFCDWLIECRQCHKRYRLDNLISADEFSLFLEMTDKSGYSLKANCSNCNKNDFHSPRQFNLLLSTDLEITDGKESIVYLRPETCQGIFTNFATIQQSTHRQLPFGIGQIGKSFRNEITLHHGIFRTREFEQMELEFFCQTEDSEKWWIYWTEKSWNFLNKVVTNNQLKIKQVDLKSEELPHYAKKTQDLYFNYRFGWGELCSNSHRGNYDLTQHSNHSKKNLSINGIIPEVIEVSFGVERLMLAILEDAYQEETKIHDDGSKKIARSFLKLPALLSPYFIAIVPLSDQLKEKSYQIYLDLLPSVDFNITYEKAPNIGKAYRRQDAIGTFYCVTIDFQTIQDETVTLRDRDTMKQAEKRINISELKKYLNDSYEKFKREFTS
ncbi:MAG: glycine--tRNA ligase [Spiroplasmataceae bacterium]|nr:glycine--tRNA ligase [Spiroplasmataceae bacterium]